MAPPLAELTAQAQTLTSAGDLAGARDVLADALNPADADPQRASPDLALAAALHARILTALGDPHAAETWAGFAHAAEEHLHGPHDERTIAAAATHAAVLQRIGDHDRAAQLYHALVDELTATDGPASARVLAAEADLATAEHASGQCTAARNRLADAWARHNQEYGENAPAGIKMLARLAAMERSCGHDRESLAHFELAQELCARYLPADHPLGRQVARLAGAGGSGRHACEPVQRPTGPAGDGPAAGVTRVPAPTPGTHPVRHEPPAATEVSGRHTRAEPAVAGASASPVPTAAAAARAEDATPHGEPATRAEDATPPREAATPAELTTRAQDATPLGQGATPAEFATRAQDATPLGQGATPAEFTTQAEAATPAGKDAGPAQEDATPIQPAVHAAGAAAAVGEDAEPAQGAATPAEDATPAEEATPPRGDVAHAEQDPPWLEVTRPPQAHGFTPRHAHPAPPPAPTFSPLEQDQVWVDPPAEQDGAWSEPAVAQPLPEAPIWDDPPPADQQPPPVQPTETSHAWPQPQPQPVQRQPAEDDHAWPQPQPAQRQPTDDHHVWPEPQPIHPAEGRPAPQPMSPMPGPPVEEHGAWSETPPGRTAEHHDDWPQDPAHHQDQPASYPSPGAWDGPPPIPAQAQQPWPETVQPEPALAAAPAQQVYQAPAPAQEWTVAPPGPWPPDSVPPGAHAPDTYPPGPELDRRLPVPVDQPDRRSSRQPLVLGTLLVAGIAAAAAIVVATLPRGDDTSPAAAPAATASPAASVSVAPTNAAVAPTGVTLRDNRDSVQLTWRYPKGSEGPVLISGGRTGQEQRAFQQLPAGTTDYVVYGLNRQNNYCFSVAVVYTVDQVAASDAVCTKRK